MAGISGNKREVKDFSKKVGLFEAKVLAINPDREELEKLLDTEVEKDPEYLGESADGNRSLRLVFWIEDVKSKSKFALNFFLEDAETKPSERTGNVQYASSQGKTTWVDNPDNFPEWFMPEGVTYHRTRKGESELLEFLNSWLDINRKGEYSIEVDWNELMKGRVKSLRDLLQTDLPQNVICLATVRIKEPDEEGGEVKEYQGVYNRKFLPAYHMKFFRTIRFTEEKLTELRKKQKKDLKTFEKYALEVTDPEYGVKDFYGKILGELKDYDANENVVTSNAALINDESSPEYD